MKNYIRYFCVVALVSFIFSLLLPASRASRKSINLPANNLSLFAGGRVRAGLALLAGLTPLDEGYTDLGVSKMAASDTTAPGSNITYTIVVNNAGPDTALTATLNDVLPLSTTFVSMTQTGGSAGWNCTDPGAGSTGTVTCTNPSLAPTPGDTFKLIVQVDPQTPTSTFINNTATVSTTTFDSNDENNSSTASVGVVGATSADLGVVKMADSETVVAGGNVTYTIIVNNIGPSAASAVEVNDKLPGDMTFVSVSAPAGWNCTDPGVGSVGTINCTATSLAANTNATITLVGQVPMSAPAGTEYENIANVKTSTPDTNNENNSSSALATVVACQTFQQVTTNADDGSGSLRQAVLNACSDSLINFDMTRVTSPITLTTGEIVIDKNLTIAGPFTPGLTISGNHNSRIFRVVPSVNVSISNLTFADGKENFGGGIYNLGNLVISNSTFTGNKAVGGEGGAIDTEGGSLFVYNTTISGNSADTDGGGLLNCGTSSTTLVNVTITNNRSDADNNTIGDGGGIGQVSSNPIILRNTLVAGNFKGTGSTKSDFFVLNGSSVDSNSANNLIGVDTGLSGISNGNNGNLIGTNASPLNPLLGPLASNGGPTMTHLLLPGSPAIGTGNNALAKDQTNTTLTTDQRGTGFPRFVIARVDIGAVEVNYTVSATAGTPQSATINTAFGTQMKVTITESGVPQSGISVTFTAPASGASGAFSPSAQTATIITDANGSATAPVFTANGTAGSYNVVASIGPGLLPTATFALTNTKGLAQVTLSNLNQTYDGTPKSATVATNPPGLAVVVTYDGSTTPPTNAGSYQVSATVTDPNYTGSATGTLNIGKAGQTITFGALADKTFGNPDFNVSATASSNLAVSFSASGNCTVTGSTVHLTGAGFCTITASQADNSNYNAAASVPQSFNIAKAVTTTALTSSTNPSDLGQSVTFTATVTSTAGTPTGTVQFKVDGNNAGTPAALSGGVATFSTTAITTGPHTVTADYSGDTNFNASTGTLSGGQVVKQQPTLSINDVSLSEGNSGTTAFNFTVTLSTASSLGVTVSYATANGTASAPNDFQAIAGTQLTFNPGETSKTVTVTVNGDTSSEFDETFFVNLSGAANATISRSQGVGTILNDDGQAIQLSSATYNVTESGLHATIIVNRTGDISAPATVDYATSDPSGLTPCANVTGNASSRCDYATSVGTIRFGAGENSRNVFIPIVNDVYVEGAETFTFTLSNPTGGGGLTGISAATITINDDDNGVQTNPITNDAFYIRQLYIDFLGREPEPSGLQGWLDILNHCPVPTDCDRIAVALGFIRSPEFQDRGYFTFRFYPAALGRNPTYAEFIPDMARLSGFLSVSDLESSKNAYVQQFMSRQEFKNLYDPTIGDPTSYVNKLLQTAGLPNHPFKVAWINGLTNNTLTRAQVLRQLIESLEVYNKFFNQGFVVMNYFGFLRRDPDAAYQTWINLFNSTGDYRVIINGFINSPEYPLRFGP